MWPVAERRAALRSSAPPRCTHAAGQLEINAGKASWRLFTFYNLHQRSTPISAGHDLRGGGSSGRAHSSGGHA